MRQLLCLTEIHGQNCYSQPMRHCLWCGWQDWPNDESVFLCDSLYSTCSHTLDCQSKYLCLCMLICRAKGLDNYSCLLRVFVQHWTVQRCDCYTKLMPVSMRHQPSGAYNNDSSLVPLFVSSGYFIRCFGDSQPLCDFLFSRSVQRRNKNSERMHFSLRLLPLHRHNNNSPGMCLSMWHIKSYR